MAVYCAETKSLFVHVQKTGGSSIQKWLYDNTDGVPVKGKKHWPMASILQRQPNMEIDFSFAVVRNPWDYAVSWYFFRLKRAQRRLESNTTKPKGKFSKEYNEWVVNESAKGIEHWFETINPSLQQHTKVKDLDYVMKLENLENDFVRIQQHFNCYEPLPHLNYSQRQKDYRQYYNKKTKNLIAKKFATDIELFGFEF